MRRTFLAVLCPLILGLLGTPSSAEKNRTGENVNAASVGPPSSAKVETARVNDAAVERAIARGVEFLISQQEESGMWAPLGNPPNRIHVAGPTALATYAILESGVSPRDPRMRRALRAMVADGGSTSTYTRGLRANAYLSAVRQGAGEYLDPLRRDVDRLVESTDDGDYDYDARGKPGAHDNSNAQYGLLGVWAGKQHGLDIPQEYWLEVIEHWKKHQRPDGGWGYSTLARGQDKDTRATMCAAGVASLFVCFDSLRVEDFASCDVALAHDPDYRIIQRGLDWFDFHFAATMQPANGRKGLDVGDMYYYLYGVERVGLASGHKYFGTADWYRLGVRWLLDHQNDDGSWKARWGKVIGTGYALLFLVRGRMPVLFNKLQFDGDWNNRPRDCAYLTRWMSRTFERNVAWQVVNLRVPAEEWHDAPIVYISGSRAPRFTDEQLDQLRSFVWQGGTILSVSECGGEAFGQGIREAYRKIFPLYTLERCKNDHELYSLQFRLPGRPRFEILSNGVRPLAIHTDADLSKSWQLQQDEAERTAFEVAANVYMYVTGRTFRNRAAHTWPRPRQPQPGAVKITRLKHDGNYDPEPLAYERFARLMRGGVEVLGPMPIEELAGSGAKLAVLTGTGELSLPDEEQEALRRFVLNGGTLLIDAAGGSRAFAYSAARVLRRMYGATALQRLEAASPVYAGIKHFGYRTRARLRLSDAEIAAGKLEAVFVAGRPAVLYSHEDITAGLVGYPSYTCDGYAPETALALMKNIARLASGK